MSEPTRPTAASLRALARRDPALGRALRRVEAFPGFPSTPAQRWGSHFDSLARAIVYQQLSGKAAGTIHRRFCALAPGPPSRPPRPAEVLALSEEELRGAGLSRAKSLALHDLADKVESGELRLQGIGRLADDEIIERLVTVRGIGVWSAQMFLMFRLGRLDVLATGDLGLQEGLRRLDGLEERPSPAALAERGECWSPLRSVASWVLWRLADTAL